MGRKGVHRFVWMVIPEALWCFVYQTQFERHLSAKIRIRDKRVNSAIILYYIIKLIGTQWDTSSVPHLITLD